MNVIICKTYEEVSERAADMIAKLVKSKPDCTLGLATGSTPVGMYRRLVEEYKAGKLDFSRVSSFNLDEYYPISRENDQSYYYFMNENLFDHVNIDRENINIPNGEAKDPEAECRAYDEKLAAHGAVDIQVLGIGQNGHIGFNEPGRALFASTHITDLTESTIAANSRFFESEADVPRRALTMGMGSILSARSIILLANGRSKHDAVKALLDDVITTDIPATLLKVHPSVTLICDEEAYNG